MANEVYTTGVLTLPSDGRAYLNPGLGREMTIHNISVSGPCTLEIYDTNLNSYVQVDSLAEAGSWMAMFLHCTESCHYCLYNGSFSDLIISANGRYSK